METRSKRSPSTIDESGPARSKAAGVTPAASRYGAIHGTALLLVADATMLCPQFMNELGKTLITSAADHVCDVQEANGVTQPCRGDAGLPVLPAHAPVFQLSALATQPDALEGIGTAHEIADRAGNTFSRLMQTWEEARRSTSAGAATTGHTGRGPAKESSHADAAGPSTVATVEQGFGDAPVASVRVEPTIVATDTSRIDLPTLRSPHHGCVHGSDQPGRGARRAQMNAVRHGERLEAVVRALRERD